MIVILGEFNSKPSNWYKHEKTIYGGFTINAKTSQFSLPQWIQELTHTLLNSSPCIDLIFSSQPSLEMGSGVYSSLHENCYHKLVYAKFVAPTLSHSWKVSFSYCVPWMLYWQCCCNVEIASGIYNFFTASILGRQTHNIITTLSQRWIAKSPYKVSWML